MSNDSAPENDSMSVEYTIVDHMQTMAREKPGVPKPVAIPVGTIASTNGTGRDVTTMSEETQPITPISVHKDVNTLRTERNISEQFLTSPIPKGRAAIREHQERYRIANENLQDELSNLNERRRRLQTTVDRTAQRAIKHAGTPQQAEYEETARIAKQKLDEFGSNQVDDQPLESNQTPPEFPFDPAIVTLEDLVRKDLVSKGLKDEELEERVKIEVDKEVNRQDDDDATKKGKYYRYAKDRLDSYPTGSPESLSSLPANASTERQENNVVIPTLPLEGGRKQRRYEKLWSEAKKLASRVKLPQRTPRTKNQQVAPTVSFSGNPMNYPEPPGRPRTDSSGLPIPLFPTDEVGNVIAPIRQERRTALQKLRIKQPTIVPTTVSPQRTSREIAALQNSTSQTQDSLDSRSRFEKIRRVKPYNLRQEKRAGLAGMLGLKKWVKYPLKTA